MNSFAKCFLSLLMFFQIENAWALKVGLVLDKGGKDDKSFNSAAYQGAMRAQKELGIELKYVETPDNASLENFHRQFAKKDFDLIIGVGFAQQAAVQKIAAQSKDKNFLIIDAEVKAPNVKSVMFREHEGSFLVGAAAALKSTTGTVGFVGGMEIPLIKRFAVGYSAGAKAINPKIKIIENYVGVTPDAWNNPAKAKELALSQISSGADVIFAAAGASGNGVFDAVEEKKKLAIGVDSNQNGLRPGFILTSMVKKVDQSVFDAIKEVKESKFKSGISELGLKAGGIDYSIDQYNEKILTADII
ncbi:MAG: BMP family ABC transporter substrate-binding protein, partial [Bdellovibrionota bacterium]